MHTVAAVQKVTGGHCGVFVEKDSRQKIDLGDEGDTKRALRMIDTFQGIQTQNCGSRCLRVD